MTTRPAATDVCPCCYSLTLVGRRHFEICEVCFWEDDGQDDKDADVVRGGPNGKLSLTMARANYATNRACNPLHSASIRRPTPDEMTERSMISIVSYAGEIDHRTFTYRDQKQGTENGTLEIECPKYARDAVAKRFALLAAYHAKRTGSGDLLTGLDLSGADLRDMVLTGTPGEVDLFQACLDEADLFLAVMHKLWAIGATFRGANLRAAHICNAILRYAKFDGADLTGARLLNSEFTYSSLREANLGRANCNKCDFSEANLTDADMTFGSFEGANFDGANLTGATITDAYFDSASFNGAVLTGLDLTTANFSGAYIGGAIIDAGSLVGIPVIPDIHKAIYAAASKLDAFDMRTWHSCETTHCRAGWVVTLAGAAGSALEDEIGTASAATLIYLASDPNLQRIPDFFASNEDAMADMKRLAFGEPA